MCYTHRKWTRPGQLDSKLWPTGPDILYEETSLIY
jgi:hypothetical protein